MAEAMISREEADVLRNAINLMVNDFDRMGFNRGTIGAALTGIGLALVHVHCSHDEAMRIVGALESAMVSGDRGMQ